MSTITPPAAEKVPPTKLLFFGLLAAVFATNVIDVFAPLLNPEIAQSFNITVGTAVQLSAFSSIAGVFTGLTLSAFSIRVRYKTLLVAGVLCIVACALGVFLAPTFLFAQIFYSLNGVGSVIVGVMAATLIGELYPLEKKARTVSWILVTGQLAVLIGNPITGFMANSGITGWRTALLWFMLPVTLVSLILVVILVPARLNLVQLNAKKAAFLYGFKQVLSNKSAVACLANSFLVGAFFSSNIFAPSFLKSVFDVPPYLRGLVPVVAGSLLIAGMIIGGLLVNRIGRKTLTFSAAIVAIAFSVTAYTLSIFIQNIWLVLFLRWASAFVGGFPIVAATNLALEQIPKFRGTMMSLSSALNGMGGAFGIFLGGALLNLFTAPLIGYPAMMGTLGAMGIAGALLVLFLAKDPCKPQPEK